MLAEWILHFVNTTWDVVVLSAPWLLLGFFFAGCVYVLIPSSIIARHLQTPGLPSILKATMIGVPLPICSCGVIPLAISLRKKGASRGATTAFLVSTPEIGVDSFTLSWFLLGPIMAFARMLTAVISSITIGMLVEKLTTSSPITSSEINEAHKLSNIEPKSSCCSNNSNSSRSLPNSDNRKFEIIKAIRKVLHYGFVEMVRDLATMLIFGLLCAGLVSSLIPDNYFTDSPLNRHVAILSMLILSMPTYVCSVATTPLAAVLLAKGLDPGAVLVFLLGGPVTNMTTMFAIRKELGKAALAIYIIGIFLLTLIAGYVLSYGFAESYEGFILSSHMTHHKESMSQLWGAALLLLLLSGFNKRKI